MTLEAFNAADASVGLTSLSITSALGWQQLLLPVVPGTSIDHFTVSVETGICDMLFDDLFFDAPVGSATADHGLGGRAPPRPSRSSAAAPRPTTVTLRRTGGSTGRVNLTVVNLPTGVTRWSSPAQANGSDLRTPVTITLTGAPNAPPAGPVSVTLRATPVDSTAGSRRRSTRRSPSSSGRRSCRWNWPAPPPRCMAPTR